MDDADLHLLLRAQFELVHWTRMQGNVNNADLDQTEIDLLSRIRALGEKCGIPGYGVQPKW